jgi:hypothetical protein
LPEPIYLPLSSAVATALLGWKLRDWFRNGPDRWPGGEMWGPLDRKVWFWGGTIGWVLATLGCATVTIVMVIGAVWPPT